MRIKGYLNRTTKDFDNSYIEIKTNDSLQALQEGLAKYGKEDLLDIEIKKHRNKRSLDANAYMWVLIQEIAQAIGSDKDTIYLDMLGKYGVFTHGIFKSAAAERIKSEWRLVKDLGEITTNGRTGIQLQCYFGSSTYNSSEMSKLIDGIVREAKDLGIKTIEEIELEKIKSEWCK